LQIIFSSKFFEISLFFFLSGISSNSGMDYFDAFNAKDVVLWKKLFYFPLKLNKLFKPVKFTFFI